MSHSTNVAERWRKWKQMMDLYLNLAMLGKSKKEKCGAFLYMIWQTSRDIHNTMTFDEEKEKLDVLFTKFETGSKSLNKLSIVAH